MVLLSLPFSETEVAKAVNGMKTDSAPGLNGFTVIFFKNCGLILRMGL
jgi:hypothetical protein